MNHVMSPEIRELIRAAHYHPSVILVMPFEPKMCAKPKLASQLTRQVSLVEMELSREYADELAGVVLQKLRKLVSHINFNTYRQSIAIFVSPLFEKILYLDMPVEEKVIINNNFRVREVVAARKELHNFLVLVLSGGWNKVYLSEGNRMQEVKVDTPGHVDAWISDVPAMAIGEGESRQDILLRKFLKQTDNGLKQLLEVYPFPLFVMGTTKMLRCFRSLTAHENSISGYLEGDYSQQTGGELMEALNPCIEDWKKLKQDYLLRQLENMANSGNLAAGISEVRKEVLHHAGSLLVVEKDFSVAQGKAVNLHGAEPEAVKYSPFSYIGDMVDEAIEKVLEDGGTVEFVDPGLLATYEHIALVKKF